MSDPRPGPPPLGVYVHWPYCARICPYCDFNVVRDRGQAEQAALAGAIVQDLKAHAALTGPRRLASVFLGGGTPSLMQPEWVEAIVRACRELWTPDGELEVSLEANPTDAEAARFQALAAAGVERLSLGVQSMDDRALAFLGRNHGAAEALAALRTAAAVFPRVSLDLIYALPGQSPAGWAEELRRAAGLGAGHISPYQLTIEPGAAFARAVRRGRFTPPDPDLAADLYETTQEVLGALGFEAYEVSNHARGPRARSRHNLIYWRGLEYVGAGPGAHGRLELPGGRTATRAHSAVRDYLRAVAETGLGWAEREALDPVEVAEERLFMGLRTLEGVALHELAPLGLHPGHQGLRALVEDGFLRLEGGRLAATAAGRPLLDRLVAELAA